MYKTYANMARHLLFLYLGFLLCGYSGVECTTADEINRLIQNITGKYNSMIRPPYNNSETLHVQCGFALMSVNEFDAKSGVLDLTGAIMMIWTDDRLSWDPNYYSGITEILLNKQKVWYPKLLGINPAENLVEMGGDTSFLIRTYSTGRMLTSMGENIKVICTSDMTYFPFDVQTCEVRFATWSYLGHEVYLNSSNPQLDLTYYTKSNLWNLDSTRSENFEFGNDVGLIKFIISIRRKPLFFCMNMLGPFLILALLNPLVFLLPPSSGERVSYTVTVFLSFVLFLTVISDSMPESSTPVASVSYFLVATVVLSAGIIVSAILNLRFYDNDNSDRPPKWLFRLTDVLSLGFLRKCRCCKNKSTNEVEHMDNEKEHSEKCVFDAETEVNYVVIAKNIDKLSFVFCMVVLFVMTLAYIIIIATAP